MKQIALTFVALFFSLCVSFAQTTPPQQDETSTPTELALDNMSNTPDEAVRRDIKVEELPEAVQEQLKQEEFAAFDVVSVAEFEAHTSGEPSPLLQYEIALQNETVSEPVLVVFDENGQLLSQTTSSVNEEADEEDVQDQDEQ